MNQTPTLRNDRRVRTVALERLLRELTRTVLSDVDLVLRNRPAVGDWSCPSYFDEVIHIRGRDDQRRVRFEGAQKLQNARVRGVPIIVPSLYFELVGDASSKTRCNELRRCKSGR